MVQALSEQQGKTEFNQKFTQYIFEHPAIIILLLIPNIALFSRWYFKRHGYNYAEHLVLNIYLVGELSLFGVILNPLYKYTLSGPSFSFAQIWLQSLLSLCFLGWGYVQFFQPKRKWWCWLKAMLAVLSGYVFMLIMISVLVALIIILCNWLA